MRVLQIGRDDWSGSCQVPAGVEWVFVGVDDSWAFDVDLIGRVDVTIIDAVCEHENLQAIDSRIAPYTLIVAGNLKTSFDEACQHFFARKLPVYEDLEDRQSLVDRLPLQYFDRQFGQKLEIRKTVVSPFYSSDTWYEGNSYLAANIDIDGDFRQLMMWKENIRYENHRALALWPEYVKDPDCEIEFVVQLIQSGTPDVILTHKSYGEAELAEPIIFSQPTSGYLSCSFFAKGKGLVKIGPIHYRHSRLGAGEFLPGGKRIVDSRREELFYYFHPGNLKPPLNIYFAGYRPAEGFEGFFMMSGFGHPFLLFTDPRLEGGRFYLGSDEIEGQVQEVIREHIDSLGLREEDVIFSGMSMGSFGALYYGSQFRPLAIIVGKPIVDLGYLAKRGRLVRPKDFLTIFDIVNFWNRPDKGADTAGNKRDGKSDALPVEAFTEALIERWHGDPGFGDTKILLSYMEQDDYDDEAYYSLLRSQTGKPTTVIARGYQGRHNDDNTSIVAWFVNQYKRVIGEYLESR